MHSCDIPISTIKHMHSCDIPISNVHIQSDEPMTSTFPPKVCMALPYLTELCPFRQGGSITSLPQVHKWHTSVTTNKHQYGYKIHDNDKVHVTWPIYKYCVVYIGISPFVQSLYNQDNIILSLIMQSLVYKRLYRTDYRHITNSQPGKDL